MTTKSARRVRCLFCKRPLASARFPKRPHGTNVFCFLRGGSLHAACAELELDQAVENRRNKPRPGGDLTARG
jgi:hypothetical protein